MKLQSISVYWLHGFSFYPRVPCECVQKKCTFKFDFIHLRLLGTPHFPLQICEEALEEKKIFTRLWSLVMPHHTNGGHTGCLAMIKWIHPFQSMHNFPVWLDMNCCFNKRPEPITGGNRLAAHIASSLEACKPLMSVSLSDQNVAVGTHKSHADSLIYLR